MNKSSIILICGIVLGYMLAFTYYNPKIRKFKQLILQDKQYKRIRQIISSRNTIVNKYDKIKEIVDKDN